MSKDNVSKEKAKELNLNLEISKFTKKEGSNGEDSTYKWNNENGNPFKDNLPIPAQMAKDYEAYQEQYAAEVIKEICKIGYEEIKKEKATAAVFQVPNSTNLSKGNIEIRLDLDATKIVGGFGEERKTEKGVGVKVKIKQQMSRMLKDVTKECVKEIEGKEKK